VPGELAQRLGAARVRRNPLLSHHSEILVPGINRGFLFVRRSLEIHRKPHRPDEKADNASRDVLRYRVAFVSAR
jgi:hypothetical protein